MIAATSPEARPLRHGFWPGAAADARLGTCPRSSFWASSFRQRSHAPVSSLNSPAPSSGRNAWRPCPDQTVRAPSVTVTASLVTCTWATRPSRLDHDSRMTLHQVASQVAIGMPVQAMARKLRKRQRVLRGQLARSSKAGEELARLSMPNPTSRDAGVLMTRGSHASPSRFSQWGSTARTRLRWRAARVRRRVGRVGTWADSLGVSTTSWLTGGALSRPRGVGGGACGAACLHPRRLADVPFSRKGAAPVFRWTARRVGTGSPPEGITQAEVGLALTASFTVTTLGGRRISLQDDDSNCVTVSAANAALNVRPTVMGHLMVMNV